MAKTRVKLEKRYTIDWYTSSGFCYRTQANCPYSHVKNAKSIAKELGETIKYEYTHTIRYEY